MKHPIDTRYSVIRSTARDNGQLVQDFLDTLPGQPFGRVISRSKDGLAVVISDPLHVWNWGHMVSMDPRFLQFQFNGSDKLSYVPFPCHDLSITEIESFIKIQGGPGELTWLPLVNISGAEKIALGLS